MKMIRYIALFTLIASTNIQWLQAAIEIKLPSAGERQNILLHYLRAC